MLLYTPAAAVDILEFRNRVSSIYESWREKKISSSKAQVKFLPLPSGHPTLFDFSFLQRNLLLPIFCSIPYMTFFSTPLKPLVKGSVLYDLEKISGQRYSPGRVGLFRLWGYRVSIVRGSR